jgi:hypothetical protein
MKSSGPLVVAVVLLLCVPVYLVSYFGLVIPGGVEVRSPSLSFPPPPVQYTHYRIAHKQAAVLYWPLEQMDRRIRPDAWDADLWIDVGGPGSVSGFEMSCSLIEEETTTEASFFVESDEIGHVWTIPGPGSVVGIEISCTFGADEMTTEASFFEVPEESAGLPDADPFDDTP